MNVALLPKDDVLMRPRASRATVVLAVVAVLAAIYFTRALLAPVLVALMLFLLLQPAVDRLERFRIPRLMSAFLLVFALSLLIVGPILALWQTAVSWIDDAPQYLEQLEERIAEWTQPVVEEAAVVPDETVAVATVTDGKPAQIPPESLPPAAQGEAAREAPASRVGWIFTQAVGPLLSQTQQSLVAICITLLSTFFLLASGRTFLNRVLQLIPKFSEKRNAVGLILDLQAGVSSYLITLTVINTVFGLVAGVSFWLLEVPNAAMWGLGAAVCNFVPYLGPIAFSVLFIPACLLTYDTAAAALVPPMVFFGLNIVEAYIIGPHIYGHRLSLHPLTVFVGLLLCAWVWGIAGALIAVPLVMCINMTCQRFESLHAISTLLCGSDPALPSPPAGTEQPR